MKITHKIPFTWKVMPPIHTKQHKIEFGSAGKGLFPVTEMTLGELHSLLPPLLSCCLLKIWTIVQPMGSAVLFHREFLGSVKAELVLAKCTEWFTKND